MAGIQAAASLPVSSPVNISKYKRVFSSYDKDRDGRLTKAELYDALLSLDYTLDDMELSTIVTAVCGDEDSVDFDEFLEAMEKINFVFNKELMDSFRIFDINGDGYITFSELKEVMVNKFGNTNLADSTIQAMIRKADTDGDGRVNYSEFAVILNDCEQDS